MKNCRTHTIASWILQLIAAAILAQTLFFKFSGAEESKFIFTTLGVEPWGRVASGCAELVAVILLLAPRTVTLGALLAPSARISPSSASSCRTMADCSSHSLSPSSHAARSCWRCVGAKFPCSARSSSRCTN